MLFLNTTIYGLKLGLCYAVAALGMYIAYSILDFPDLTTDGSFPLGGVISTVVLYRLGFPPLLALAVAFIVGALMGALTGVLHVKFRISKLLSGIIVMTGLLSVTLALTILLTDDGFTVTNFSYVAHDLHGLFNGGNAMMSDGMVLLVLLVVAVVAKILLDLFFQTKMGFMLTATGNNETLVTSLGKNCGSYKVLGLAIANGLVAFSGGLYTQLTMNYDNTSGSGKVVLTLASVIIGLAVFSKAKHVKPTTAVIVGALIYSLCLNYFTLVDPNGTYLKIMNAVCFAVILIANNQIKAVRPRGGKASKQSEVSGS